MGTRHAGGRARLGPLPHPRPGRRGARRRLPGPGREPARQDPGRTHGRRPGRGPPPGGQPRRGQFRPARRLHRRVRDGRAVSGWERAQRLAELGWGEWNLATERTLWTPQMYEMFGRDRADGPMALEELPSVVVPDDLPLVDEQIRTLLEFREAVENEFRIQHRHGVRHLCVYSEPILDGDGVPVKVRSLVQDVTKNRRRERALAVAHERATKEKERAELEHRITVQLQDTILPVRRGLISLPGLTVGVRYLPGEELTRLGGDWFKARLITDGRVLLAIGDAMGHGLTAASIMLQMRSGLAGLAYTGAPAGRLATWLNDLIGAGRTWMPGSPRSSWPRTRVWGTIPSR
ncbi:PP2C family protein-serine/threonine phosphatase [Nonomuraea sp. NPDC052265]|uniref:PP2C family protein-serine/threonine phosphatase n=1 Tax=Nonomuraea sp. NPDC052265 TaxID=3364374 RepID=UPI0037C5DCB1